MSRYLARTDSYGHTFDEFDIISNLYPIVPDYFYDIVYPHSKDGVLNNHFKRIGNCSNGIAAFFEQSPLEIDEDLGLYIADKSLFGRKKTYVRKLDQKRSSFYLSEIRPPVADNVEKVALTVFIAPRTLSEEELIEVKTYEEKVPSFYKGVTEGWSIIVSGEHDDNANAFIKAGKCTRNELVKLIPSSFWEQYKDHFHVFPNGTILEDLK